MVNVLLKTVILFKTTLNQNLPTFLVDSLQHASCSFTEHSRLPQNFYYTRVLHLSVLCNVEYHIPSEEMKKQPVKYRVFVHLSECGLFYTFFFCIPWKLGKVD